MTAFKLKNGANYTVVGTYDLYNNGLDTTLAALLTGSEGSSVTLSLSSSSLVTISYGAGQSTTVRWSDGASANGLAINNTGGYLLDWGGNAGQATFTGGTRSDSIVGGTAGDLLDGGSGNDTLAGHGGNDTISGGDNADLISGGAGNDALHGGGFADTLYGGDGDDTLTPAPVASVANDQAFGEGGNDRFDIQAGAIQYAPETLDGGDGTDTIYLVPTGTAFDFTSSTVSNIEKITVTTTATVLTLGDGAVAAGGTMTIDGSALTGSSKYTFNGSAEQDGAYSIAGGEGNDSLTGGAGDDTLSGGGGVDWLTGGAGDDLFKATAAHVSAMGALNGGSGNDTLELSGGGAFNLASLTADFIEAVTLVTDAASSLTLADMFTAAGATTVVDASAIATSSNAFTFDGNAETAGAFSVTGGAGADAITGGAGADVLKGAADADTIIGGAAADTLSGGVGDDSLTGGSGNDVFVLDTDGNDVIADFGSGDLLRVTGRASTGGTITLGDGTSVAANSIQLASSGGSTTLHIDTDGTADAAELTVVLTGTYSVANFTLSGTDILYVAPVSTGGPSGGDGGATPTVDGVAVQQTVTTDSGGIPVQTVVIPTVTPSRVEETGSPTVADIPVKTKAGQTILQVQVPIGVGLQVQGDAAPRGAHQSIATLIQAIEARTAAGSSDQVDMTGKGASFLTSLPQDANLLVQTVVPTASTAPGQPIVIAGPAAAGVSNGVQVPVAMVIDASGLPSGTIIELMNVDFAAVVGAVRVTGGAGSQSVTGDGANQFMVLGADDDTLHGGGGNDFVGSEGGDDVLYGDTGVDTVTGGIGNDVLYGNQQNDLLYGGADQDTLFGGQDGDVLYGNRAADVLYGNLGSDTLFGGQDNDVLFGDQGDDLLAGNLGSDTLTGGLGADTFRIGALEEAGDVIADFEAGVDKVAVVGPSFGGLPAGTLSASHFALDNPATAGAAFVFNTRTGVLSFDADGSGAGAAVAIATLNVRSLSATDVLVLGPGG